MADGGRPSVDQRGRRRPRVILAVETSCDDTCAAVVTDVGEVRSNIVASQGLLHAQYGGVVPEIASRRHLELVDAVVADALERGGATLAEVDTVAVTQGPGLIGALLVGVSTAKALAAARRLPLAAVDHLAGHVLASTLGEHPIEPPFLSLVASGGHTFLARVDEPPDYLVLGRTLDDAAGEAFDKGARLLGLGYPGGPALDRLARGATPRRSRSRARSRATGSTSASAGSRRRCSTASATSARRRRSGAGRTWPRHTRPQSSRRS